LRSLRTYLIAFVVLIVLPGFVFGAVTTYLAADALIQRDRDEAARQAVSAAADVAARVNEMIGALNVLSRSALIDGNLHDFYVLAREHSAKVGYHLTLADADGNQYISTRVPFGTPLPHRDNLASTRRAAEAGLTSVSDVIFGKIGHDYVITVDTPVETKNGLRILTLSCDLESVASALLRTQVAAGWVIGLFDSKGISIARSPHPEDWFGKPVPAGLYAASRDEAGRGFHHISVEGVPIATVFQRVPGTGWTVAVGIPESQPLNPFKAPLCWLLAGAALTVLLTVLVAYGMGHKLYRVAGELTRRAEAVGRGEHVPITRSLTEFDQVGQALHDAAAAIHDKERALEVARAQAEAAALLAEKAARSKARLFAAASHDLRQPLSALGLFLEILCEKTKDLNVEPVWEKIRHSQDSIMELLNSLLDVSRIDSNTVVPKVSSFVVGNVLDAVGEQCGPQAQQKGLRLRVRPCPCRVTTDPFLLERIMRNLTSNAVRYTATGGVLMGWRRRPDALVLEVWDTGIGIAGDKLERIWEEFYQVANPAGDSGQGLGLGLAIVQGLAGLLGFTVSVRSRPGKGSVFAVSLPLAPADRQPRGAPALAEFG
jgi:signal transduction histidine kinase